MKNLFFACSLLLTLVSKAQPLNPLRMAAGVVGAVNMTGFRLSGNNPGNIRYNYQAGWSAGAWVRIPLTKRVSLEPAILYADYSYLSNIKGGAQFAGSISYWSAPVLLRFHVLPLLAFTLGPQFDFLQDVKDDNHVYTKTGFSKYSTSINGGIEFVARGPVTLTGRYSYGLTNMDATATTGSLKYYNTNIQIGMKIRLLGRRAG